MPSTPIPVVLKDTLNTEHNLTPRRLSVALSAALVLVTAACGGSTTASTPAASTPAAGAPSASKAVDAGVTLNGVVGEGDAFTIDLTDAAGARITTLKAGSYQVKVNDASKIHNFHLKGPGVDQKTSVPDIGETTWTVHLTAGSYSYRCDPHSSMTGSFTVT